MRESIAFWAILCKDMKTYYLKPPNISWGLLFPISWTLMFFIRTQSAIDIKELLPGVMGLSILFGATSMLAVTITFERKSRSFERLLLAPISLNILMLAKTSGAILFGIVNALVPVFFASFLIDLSGVDWVVLFLAIVLIAATSTFLGLYIAVSASEVFEAQTFSNFFRFPMMFLCGLFIPVENLPAWLQPVSYCLPLTYGADMLRGAINGTTMFSIMDEFLILCVFSMGLFWYSTQNIKKKWIQ
ncbi:MAG: ABC transporter permease [Anaeromusa sp.]|jgi:ABC-2 type transport system permease protein|uniref:ABC transporter permease n=1 Tax=Anaeromusa sp. TaxID=1872520 RepID=UPI002635210E|nr:ABC transporter permease [Anaeromusa sp.]MDD3158426.1 ABC transporter permease [Anaeromusa sp.]MEA4835622.1 ABC transporter permease [Anaeromusa sp.]NCB76204.1 ABC transporter permease [Negativicutes bacterium]